MTRQELEVPRRGGMSPKWFAILVFAIAIALWIGWFGFGVHWVARYLGASDTATGTLGQVGDLFGGINALFAAFAFAGVAVAAYYQHLSWRLLANAAQKADLQHARDSFEPLFFRLLETFAGHTTYLMPSSDMKAARPSTYGAGHHPLGMVIDHLRELIAGSVWFNAVRAKTQAEKAAVLTKHYMDLYRLNESQLGSHLRILYHVFKLIKESSVPYERKVQYANIARSTLGTDVLFLLALNCASPLGESFVPLIEEFGLLKHISRSDPPTVDQAIVEWLYAPTATMSAAERDAYWQRNPALRPASSRAAP